MMFGKPRLLRTQNDARPTFYRARWCADLATRWAYGRVRRTELEARRDLLKLIRPHEDGQAEVLVVEASDPDEARRASVRNPDYGGTARIVFQSNWRAEHPMFPGEQRRILWLQLQRQGKSGVEDYSSAPIDPTKLRTWGDVLEHFGGGNYRAFAYGVCAAGTGLLAVVPHRGAPWHEVVGEPKPFGPCPSIDWPLSTPKGASSTPPTGAP